ncbi:hypothetical protein [Pelagerythrobacter sp.]|uniref:hypothetical protein n=1 Tax=Pelagerythrobacter sp. TaxID=2800702 RepID=UPI0035B224CA
MTRGAAEITDRDVPQVGSGWEAVRADDTIQFAPVQMPEQLPPPGWLVSLFQAIGEFLAPIGRALGMSWPVFKWVLLALAVALLAWLLWRLLAPVLMRERRETSLEDEAWAPDRADALALLEDADRLAAEGRYDEATHLLLRRSVGQIAAARPDWVEPSSTARELALLPALPEAARSAFAAIAERVERSLFALRALGEDDWRAAREAYAEFALQRLPGRAA